MSKLGLLLLLLPLAGCVTAPPAAELGFSDFFVRPVGPRGQEPTEKLLSLNGQRVRVVGWVVAEEEPFPGLFMLAPLRVSIAERADGPADDLPGATLFVHLPDGRRDWSAHAGDRPVEVTGTLDLGPKEEVSGRISYVRLLLDDP